MPKNIDCHIFQHKYPSKYGQFRGPCTNLQPLIQVLGLFSWLHDLTTLFSFDQIPAPKSSQRSGRGKQLHRRDMQGGERKDEDGKEEERGAINAWKWGETKVRRERMEGGREGGPGRARAISCQLCIGQRAKKWERRRSKKSFHGGLGKGQ